jgi:hypothetical protein
VSLVVGSEGFIKAVKGCGKGCDVPWDGKAGDVLWDAKAGDWSVLERGESE